MNIREIKDLINLMNEHGLAEVEIESEGTKIKLKRGVSGAVAIDDAQYVRRSEASPAKSAQEPKEVKKEEGKSIKSPMVGTFYAAPAPDADSYVKVGSKVEVGQVVCIIEAMKLMNEIKSEVKGVVQEIHATNANPVEFGTVLYTVA